MIANFTQYIGNETRPFVIFDVGSRDCAQSIEFYNKYPNATIYAFECNPNTIELCKQNIEPYTDRITLIPGAVCDYDGTITFYPINQTQTITSWQDGNPGASSLFQSNGNYTVEHYVQDKVTVNCHRLDSIMSIYAISNVDIIWMDLQGAEKLALVGLGKHLQTVQYLHTEVSHIEMYTNQVMFSELNTYLLDANFSVKNRLSMAGWQEDAIYENNRFDIVIPVGMNDVSLIRQQIQFTAKNVIGYRNIYIIYKDLTLCVDGCITIAEDIFPFSLQTVETYHGSQSRNGWYLQQLLKLYAGRVIPTILPKYLVIDADTFFLKPTVFCENNVPLFNYGREYHFPYFNHMQKIHPSLARQHADKSGICHHMLFETAHLNTLFELVETMHTLPFYVVFLSHVVEVGESGASEYEIYFNYMLQNHPTQMQLRPLNWINTGVFNIYGGHDYISYHWFMRP